jgi:PAS domain S-box-containing protein
MLEISQLYKKIVEESPAAIIVTDPSGLICIVNDAFGNIFGYDADELIGKKIEILVPERARAKHAGLRDEYMKSPLSRPMLGGQDLSGLAKGGVEIPIQIGLNPILLSEGMFVQATVVDMRERLRQENDRRNTFLEEIHHRVKNNLALIASVLQMEKRRLNSPGKEIINVLTSIENRLRVISRLHENLYGGNNFEKINLTEYFKMIGTDLEASLSKEGSKFPKISFKTSRDFQFCSDKAICLGLMFNEFCTNSIKHAFQNSNIPPEITVSITEATETCTIIFRDNGVGIDPANESKGSIGKKIISILSQQINAETSWLNEGGTVLTFLIPKE